jgi:putative membrane protein
MRILLHWIILSAAVYFVPYAVSGVHVNTFITALIAGAVLGFINIIIKPIVKLLTLPINILTLGLFSLVLNALFFWFVASLISGFSIDNFKAALIGALIVSVINWLGNKIVKRGEE